MRHVAGRRIRVNDVRQSDWHNRKSEQNPRQADSAITGQKTERRFLRKMAQSGKERPSTREQQSEFTKPEPRTLNCRLGDNVGHFEQRPQDEIRKENPGCPGPAWRNQQSNSKKEHENAGGIRDSGSSRNPCGNRLPYQRKIGVHKSQHAKPNKTNDEQSQRRLLAVFHKDRN